MLKNKVGIDIGYNYIKVVMGNRRKIIKYGIIETPKGSIDNSKIVDISSVASSIKGFLNDNDINCKSVSFALYSKGMLIRRANIPKMNSEATEKAIVWEMSKHISEQDRNKYVCDYELVREPFNKRVKVIDILMVAAPQSIINDYIKIAEQLEMKVSAIDIGGNCISKVIACNKKDAFSYSTCVIDIGHTSVKVNIINKGSLYLETQIDIGISDVMEELIKCNLLCDKECYDYLFSQFNFIKENDSLLDNKIAVVFSEVVQKINEIIRFHNERSIDNQVNEAYIIGGGSFIRGIDTYFTKNTGIQIDILKPLKKPISKIKCPGGFDINEYANAVGLLLRKE